MNPGMKYWVATVILAFASIICFFQINSYYADTHHLNGVFGFLGAGIVLGLAAIFCVIKVKSMSDD